MVVAGTSHSIIQSSTSVDEDLCTIIWTDSPYKKWQLTYAKEPTDVQIEVWALNIEKRICRGAGSPP